MEIQSQYELYNHKGKGLSLFDKIVCIQFRDCQTKVRTNVWTLGEVPSSTFVKLEL